MRLEEKHVRWFVIGMMTEYYGQMGQKPEDYTEFTRLTVEKVWQYLTDHKVSVDGSFHDQQAHVALEAGRLFSGFALDRRSANGPTHARG